MPLDGGLPIDMLLEPDAQALILLIERHQWWRLIDSMRWAEEEINRKILENAIFSSSPSSQKN